MPAVTVPDLSPFPTDAEQAAADLAHALNQWQEDGTGFFTVPMMTAAKHYAETILDTTHPAPEVPATADRLLVALRGDDVPAMAERAVELLDTITRWEQDRSADRAADAHDRWRGDL